MRTLPGRACVGGVADVGGGSEGVAVGLTAIVVHLDGVEFLIWVGDGFVFKGGVCVCGLVGACSRKGPGFV